MESLCGMLPFISKDNPNQVYRLWLSLFLHAGILHLCLSIFFQVIHPKHPISTKNISTLDGCTSWFGKTSRLVENWINLYFIGCRWKSWFCNFRSVSTWCWTEWSLFWSHCLFICRIYTIMAAAWPTVGLFSNILASFKILLKCINSMSQCRDPWTERDLTILGLRTHDHQNFNLAIWRSLGRFR